MFEHVRQFEEQIADFYGAPYAVATDSCTHAIELCLRLHYPLVVPQIDDTNIIDAAVYWEEGGYIPDTNMCLSFQFKKHLSLGRGGMILTDNEKDYHELQKMTYDGRDMTKPWAEQDITTVGYHYYMTPETAIEGIRKFPVAKDMQPKSWPWEDYPDLSKLTVFQ